MFRVCASMTNCQAEIPSPISVAKCRNFSLGSLAGTNSRRISASQFEDAGELHLLWLQRVPAIVEPTTSRYETALTHPVPRANGIGACTTGSYNFITSMRTYGLWTSSISMDGPSLARDECRWGTS